MSVGKVLMLGNHFQLRNCIFVVSAAAASTANIYIQFYDFRRKKKILFLATEKNFNEDNQFTKSTEICKVSLSFSLFSRSVLSELCDPMDCSLRGSFVHGILQARIQEWVAISFSTVKSVFC